MIEQDRSFAFFICRGRRQPLGYDSLIARLIRSHDGRRRSISHVPVVVSTMARQLSVRDLYESMFEVYRNSRVDGQFVWKRKRTHFDKVLDVFGPC